MLKNNKVEMHQAYQWICDSCGRTNFVGCMAMEATEEDKLEQAKLMGLVDEFATEAPEFFGGQWVTYPDAVTCDYCGDEFETEPVNGEGVNGESTSDEI